MSIDATATDGNTRSNRGPKPAQVNPPRCRADPRLARERDASSPAGHERPLAHAALSVADLRLKCRTRQIVRMHPPSTAVDMRSGRRPAH